MRADYESTYRDLFGDAPPPGVASGTSDAAVLRPASGFIRPFDWTMQLQVGCPGGCLFCYVPAGPRLAPRAVKGTDGRAWGSVVRPKRHAIARLRRLLDRGRLTDTTLYWSGVTDPYASPPARTRAVWEALAATPVAKRPRRVVVQTRFRPDRDRRWIARYARETRPADGGPPALVSYSIGTDRDDRIRAWERATPLYRQRMAAIRRLREAGVWVVPTLSPFGRWDDLPATLGAFRELSIPYLTCLFFKDHTAFANTPSRFLEMLRVRDPDLLDPSWQEDRRRELAVLYGRDRVVAGREGFASLVRPHVVGTARANP